jgi:hypothetical protein
MMFPISDWRKCNKFDLTADVHYFWLEKCVINLIWLMFPISDWSIIIIGPGGLQLVVSHLFAVPVLVVWEGLEQKVSN